MREVVSEKQSWNFPQGHEIAPGRTTLKPLGGGNRYEVYLVWDEHRFSVMVAKILRPDLVEEEYALRGLRREVDALLALSHPVLLRAFDAHVDGPHPHLVVEHLEGPTLRRVIKRNGALPVEQTLPLGLHVASVIHYMAEAGWVHLDLKPDNLVMGIPPRVIDLSLARTVERAQAAHGLHRHERVHAARAVQSARGRGPAGGRVGPRRDALPRRLGPAAVPAAAHARPRGAARGPLSRSSRTSRGRGAGQCRALWRTRSSRASRRTPRAVPPRPSSQGCCSLSWPSFHRSSCSAAAARSGSPDRARPREFAAAVL